MIERNLKKRLLGLIKRHPSVGLLGPRQAGKTTLAFEIAKHFKSVYLDLESPSDRAKLSDAEAYLRRKENELVILDEIQRVPELFQVLRGLIDEGRRKGLKTARFLILGSSSLELIKQSSESLAGRIIYEDLGPLSIYELPYPADSSERLWVRGGFPDSFLAADDPASSEWRTAFIRTYLERDIPQLGPRIPSETLRRFWTMLAHSQGSLLNASKLAGNLGVSGQTINRYLDLLVDLLLVRRLSPWTENTGKRLTKSPKTYVRDSGITHALLGIQDEDQLLCHPIVGQSYEGYVIENCIRACGNKAESFFYRTSAGAEIDLLLRFSDGSLWAIEIKRSSSPKVSRGFHQACLDLKPSRKFVVYPGNESFPLKDGIEAVGLQIVCGIIMNQLVTH